MLRPSDLATEIQELRCAVGAALSDDTLGLVASTMERLGIGSECDRIAAAITTDSPLRASLREVRSALVAAVACPDGAFERVVLLRQFETALPRLSGLPVSERVKQLFCGECRYVLAPPKRATFDVMRASFVAVCELATFRRFPAGQYHWTLSGLPRSWLLKVKGRERLMLLYWIARKLRGFGPAFVPHLNAHRKNRWLTEAEANRSYYCMAQSLELQPDVKGLVASSWLRSPDTHKVSPELAWMNRTILDNGGCVVMMGPADPNCGVLARSTVRRTLYEAGQFKPTIGLVIWPRHAMLAWAARHPELGDGAAPAADSLYAAS